MSDLDKKYPLRLDTRINFKNLIPHFYISDNQTNDFYIKLTNDNKPVEVEDIIVVIAVINPNGNINSSFLDTKTEKGLIYCNLPNELKNVVGAYKARIMCISGEERIVSNTFEYKVDTDEFQVIDEITEDSEEMIVLSQMLSRLSNMEIESQANETERIANEAERIENEAERIENENLRQQAENNRNTTEEARVVAESNRISNESERVLGEQTRVENEQNRISAENKRISDENIRKENENRRLEKENNNIQAESNRVQAESNRVQAESNRKNSENARNDNEDIRKQNELKRQSNENTRITNENERIANENERAKVNANRQQAEQTRVTNERNRKEAETARVSAERNRANNESVRISNENIRKNNEEKRKEEFKAKIIEIDNALASLGTADSVNWENVVGKPTFATVATSGDYNDLTNKPLKVLPENTTAIDLYNLEMGAYLVVDNIYFNNTDYSVMFNGVFDDTLYPGSLILVMEKGVFGNLTANTYFELNSEGSIVAIGSLNGAWIGQSATDIQNNLSDEMPASTNAVKNYVDEILSASNEGITVLPTGMTAVDYYNLEIGIYKASGTTYFEYAENCNYYNGVSHFEIFENEIISIEQQYNLVNLSNGKYCWLDETGKITDIGNTSEAWTGELATVATSGSYNDLADKPTIPEAGIPSLVGSNENVVKIWELEDGVYNLSGILKYRYDYYSTETGGTLEGWQIEGLYIIYNTGDDPNNVGRTIKICKNLKYNFYFKYSLLNGTIESSRYDPEYIKEDNSNPIGEEEAIIVLPNDLTASDYYNLPVGLYRVTTDFFFDATTNCELRNGLTNDMLTLPNGSLISCMGQGLIINLSYSMYLILNDTGEVYVVGSTNNAWTGELATVATTGSYNDLTDKPTIPSEYNLPIANQTTLGGIKVGAGLSITADGILSATGGATADSVEWANVLGKPTFATVATSGDYNDLTNKPTIPHYNETLIFEISGETDYGNFYANRYFNISALSLDETKSYVGKHKPIMDFPDELIHEFVYNKEANALMDEMNSVYIYNHKSYNGTNFIEDENSAVLTYDIKPMTISSGYNGYFRLYEIEKLELNNNCLSDDVSIKNSLTVGSRIGDIGKYSVVEGNENTASGNCSHAEGISTIASGDYSHSEGDNTTASGGCSHAEGINTIASGDYSHAEGNHTRASGNHSHAEGYYTIASTDFQHVQGRLNIEDTGRIYAHIVGNGMSDTERRNAYTLDWNGNAWYQGKLSQDGTPTEDKDLATKKYVDDSIATVNADTIDNLHIWTGTQSQYDALGTKDSNTIYLIKEG